MATQIIVIRDTEYRTVEVTVETGPKIIEVVTLGPQGPPGLRQFDVLAGAPASPTNGAAYYDSTTHKFRGYANGAWVDLN